jgi:hypothetical protein
MTDGQIGAVIGLGLMAFSLPFLVATVAAYRGRWIQWLLVRPPNLPVGRYWGLYMMGFLGAGCFSTGVYSWAVMAVEGPGSNGTPMQLAWLVLELLLTIVGIVSSYWLPRGLKPLWLLDWEDSGADVRYIAATVQLRHDYRRRRRREDRLRS